MLTIRTQETTIFFAPEMKEEQRRKDSNQDKNVVKSLDEALNMTVLTTL